MCILAYIGNNLMAWCYKLFICDAIYPKKSTSTIASVKRHLMYYPLMIEKTQIVGYINYNIQYIDSCFDLLVLILILLNL